MAKYLSEKSKDVGFAGQRSDFEAAVIVWMAKLSGYAAPRLTPRENVSVENGKIISAQVMDLAKDAKNLQFSAGLNAIHDFGIKSMADEGSGGESAFNSGVPAISCNASALAAEYAGVDSVEITFKETCREHGG